MMAASLVAPVITPPGYFTGARLNELCQLYKADLFQIENTWVIQINDKFEGQRLKNAFSRRLIPIHPKLIELGFLCFVQSIKHERIFPELKNQRDGFGRFKSKFGFSKGHDFHSLRNTVATQFKQSDVSAVIEKQYYSDINRLSSILEYGDSPRKPRSKELSCLL
ncbi:hypothetical protein L4D09_04770 [Photobacterium makurazakiensis]|uniref:hypothetical protein n=1 Tax=Photobacterium makurazakiensis TaxID=2910234 RepID=UPI003D0F6F17